MNKTYGDRLKEARLSFNPPLSQEWVCMKAREYGGIAHKTLLQIEKGRTKPRDITKEILARIFPQLRGVE